MKKKTQKGPTKEKKETEKPKKLKYDKEETEN